MCFYSLLYDLPVASFPSGQPLLATEPYQTISAGAI